MPRADLNTQDNKGQKSLVSLNQEILSWIFLKSHEHNKALFPVGWSGTSISGFCWLP